MKEVNTRTEQGTIDVPDPLGTQFIQLHTNHPFPFDTADDSTTSTR